MTTDAISIGPLTSRGRESDIGTTHLGDSGNDLVLIELFKLVSTTSGGWDINILRLFNMT